MRLVAPLIVLALLAAGCVTPAAEPNGAEPANAAPEETWARIMDLMEAVPCEASTVGAGTSDNLLPLSHLSFAEESGDHGEMDIRGDLALVARYQQGGFEVVDLSDPASLSLLASFELAESIALDVKWTTSGDGAIIGDRGKVHLVDLADPAEPVLASTFDARAAGLTPYQSHMVLPWTAEDGTEYVYVATQTGRAPMYILERDGWELKFVGTYSWSPVLASDPALGQHDVTIYHDELLDAPVLYIAEGILGWSAASLANPAAPERIGGSLGLEPGAGYAHTVRVEFVDGKRIVATMQEVGANTLKIYDATNLQAPVLLARWNADASRPHIPQHNIQLKDGLLYLAHYTEGIYIFDVNSVVRGPPLVGTLDMEPMAHFAVENQRNGGTLGFANVWDVALSKGIVYVGDSTEGLTSVGFGCLAAGDPAQTATE